MMVTDEEYQKHAVFADLEQYIAFYEDLAQSVFGFVSPGTRAICNIASYLFSSIQGTMVSIRAILRDGRINDAYALLRKFYDSAIINIYTGLYLQEHVSIENFVVKQIDSWLKGREQLPDFMIMSRYIRGSPRVAPITSLLFADDRYRRLRDRCNDHTHYNFYRNVLLNDNQIALSDRRRALDEFCTDLRDVLVLHVSYMFFANRHYMMATDYLECLECGITLGRDSQYWVAPFVQDIFNRTLRKARPDIAAAIKQQSPMHIA